MSASHEQHERHECDTIATRVRHECYTNDTSATRVKNLDFDKDTSENIFSHPYISYIANERFQGEKQFHSKNYLLEMPRSHAKIHLKSANALARSRIITHCNTALFSIKASSCETNNIFFSKNY